jgi:hypothetical protein
MKHTAIDLAGSIAATGIAPLSDAERHEIAAELISSNGYRCGRVLSVLPTDTPHVWRVCGMQDGAMDSLVTFQMNARKGLVARA